MQDGSKVRMSEETSWFYGTHWQNSFLFQQKDKSILFYASDCADGIYYEHSHFQGWPQANAAQASFTWVKEVTAMVTERKGKVTMGL